MISLTVLVLLCILPFIQSISEEWADRIYDNISADFYCTKLLHVDGMVGCETPFEGTQGVIRMIDSYQAIDHLLSHAPEYRVSLMMSMDMFNTTTLNRLRDHPSLKIAGIMIDQSTRPAHQSPARKSLQSMNQPSANLADLPIKPKLIDSSTKFNRSFDWNPFGNSMRDEYYPFAVQLLSEDDRPTIKQYAQENEQSIGRSESPLRYAEFRNPSNAHENSMTCLSSGTCNPIGTYSLWASMRPVNQTDEMILAVAQLDSQSMFTASSTGAESYQSGVITLMAAAQAIGAILPAINSTANATAPNITITQPPRNIIFFFPHAESFDHIGSRKFVDDLVNFECQQVDADDSNECDRPFKWDMTFNQMATNQTNGKVGLSRFHALFEVQQVGLNSSFYYHTEHDSNPLRDQLIDTMKLFAANETDMTLNHAAPDTPGVPPAAAQAFLSVNSSLPVIVLADHAREFINPFYHSSYDTGDFNIHHTDPSSRASPSMCALATVLARTLFVAAGGLTNESMLIKADCNLVTRLIECLTIDITCRELSRFRGSIHTSSYPSHAPGRFFILPPDRFYYGDSPDPQRLLSSAIFPNFIADRMKRYFTNTSGQAYIHEAVDPALQWQYTDDIMWSATRANDTRLWTESNGIVRATRLYRVETPFVEHALLIVGLAMLIIGVITAVVGEKFAHKKLKPA